MLAVLESLRERRLRHFFVYADELALGFFSRFVCSAGFLSFRFAMLIARGQGLRPEVPKTLKPLLDELKTWGDEVYYITGAVLHYMDLDAGPGPAIPAADDVASLESTLAGLQLRPEDG